MDELLSLSVQVAESGIINPNNLECFWYAPWNIILNKYLSPPLTITSQQSLLYSTEHRDGKSIDKKLTPDFVATHYKKGVNDLIYEKKYLIVENKRFDKDLEEEVDKARLQLEDQIRIVFLDTDYKEIFGVVSVGRYWKWYKYIRKNIDRTHSQKSSWGNESYTEDGEDFFRKKYESSIKDILDYKSFESLVNRIREGFSN